jgi:hypothetical protein
MYYQNEKLNEIYRDTWPNLGWAKQMNKDIQQPNGDFLKNYPDVTRVEVITNDGREFVRYECSNVQVSLQDDGQTLKVFLFTTYE